MNKKIAMSTDWHFGKGNGKFDNIILEGIKALCQHAKENDIKILVNLGDTLDVKQTMTTSTLNNLAEAFALVNDTFDTVYLMVGNHDLSKRTNDATGHNLRIFEGYSNVILVDEPTIHEIFGNTFYMMPYFHNEILKTHVFPPADYMCGHIEIQGFMLNQFIKAKDGITAKSVTKNYNRVFLGHFHKKQIKGKVSYIGNMCRFFYGEDDDERGWTVLDLETGDSEFVEYIHPRMYKFNVSAIIEEDDLSGIFNPGDNLKLVIDVDLQYSELEELKSKLILDYKVNDLVLDDQYFAWESVADEDEESDGDEKTADEKTTIENKDQTYMEFVLEEMIKVHKNEGGDDTPRESITILTEISKQYQE